MSAGQLYGEVSRLTQDWSDGLLSTLMRSCVVDESSCRIQFYTLSTGAHSRTLYPPKASEEEPEAHGVRVEL